MNTHPRRLQKGRPGAAPTTDRIARAVARLRPIFVATSLALGGCALAPAPQQQALQRPTQAEMLAPTDAFALPPPGGPAVISVVQQRYSNALEQEIVLANASQRPGQNAIRVQLFGQAPVRMADYATLDNNLLDMTDIWSEMDEYLPGVGMTVSPYFVRNQYGAFGYAMGRYGTDLCMYAWQRIGEASTTLDDGGNQAGIGLRVRVCRTGATERQLLDVVYGMTLSAYYTGADWQPFGTTVQAIVPFAPIYPTGDVLDPVPTPAATRAATPAPAAPVATRPVIVPTGPTIPLPPGANGAPTGPTIPLPPT